MGGWGVGRGWLGPQTIPSPPRGGRTQRPLPLGRGQSTAPCGQEWAVTCGGSALRRGRALTLSCRGDTRRPGAPSNVSCTADTAFYLACDEEAICRTLHRAFPGHIVSAPRPACPDRSAPCLRAALRDMYALGSGRLILGSLWSSFSEVAGARAPRPDPEPTDHYPSVPTRNAEFSPPPSQTRSRQKGTRPSQEDVAGFDPIARSVLLR